VMLSWLSHMTFSNGDIPHFNDATNHIACTPEMLQELGMRLGCHHKPNTPLSTSGYRRLDWKWGELIADVHGISPSYQPGHAHADSLSFVMYTGNKPCIVDVGISTYTIGNTREWERSTAAHNTVTVDDKNTAEVWSGFRVGRRPQVKLMHYSSNKIEAQLRFQGSEHIRKFSLHNDQLTIRDEVSGASPAIARFYLHPNVTIERIEEGVVELSNTMKMYCSSYEKIENVAYNYNFGYNLSTRASCIEVTFKSNCEYTFSTPS